ncbi:MAG: hypothetical protein WAU77_13025 [Solirubrobacteraceae bacterium]
MTTPLPTTLACQVRTDQGATLTMRLPSMFTSPAGLALVAEAR